MWGALISGAANFFSSRATNRANVSIADKTTAANMAEAQKNREFQERMANTSYQRGIADLEKAGLNPLLAIKGGADSPSGAVGQAVGTQVKDEIGAGITSAIEAKRMENEIEKLDTELVNMEKMGKQIDSQTKKNDMETKVMSKDIPKADFINKIYDAMKSNVNKIDRVKKWEDYKENKIRMNRKP